MNFNKVKHQSVAAEFVGTWLLTLAVLASVWGTMSSLATPLLAGGVFGLLVLALGPVSGVHLNPAITIGLYSIKKVDAAHTISYLIAQLGGALLAILAMSMFMSGEIVGRLPAAADYPTFFAELLGAATLTWLLAAGLDQRFKKLEAALLAGGAFTLGLIVAGLGSNGLVNPALAIGVNSLSWPYVLGPLLGGVLGYNLYAIGLTKKGKL